ncbi:MAG TPA: cupin domain-containing protein [Gammaproteobacteria bacterium]|nr:cupin domain-containing protein [Gammaproteobacteria bacterium]
MNNIFENIPEALDAELFETLLRSPQVRIERIISRGHRSADGCWYDQKENEWVIVLKGSALLVFDDGREETLSTGDYIDLPAHTRHRVEWTDPDTDTVWLAVWY